MGLIQGFQTRRLRTRFALLAIVLASFGSANVRAAVSAATRAKVAMAAATYRSMRRKAGWSEAEVSKLKQQSYSAARALARDIRNDFRRGNYKSAMAGFERLKKLIQLLKALRYLDNKLEKDLEDIIVIYKAVTRNKSRAHGEVPGDVKTGVYGYHGKHFRVKLKVGNSGSGKLRVSGVRKGIPLSAEEWKGASRDKPKVLNNWVVGVLFAGTGAVVG